jgi:hypothetical protein
MPSPVDARRRSEADLKHLINALQYAAQDLHQSETHHTSILDQTHNSSLNDKETSKGGNRVKEKREADCGSRPFEFESAPQ